MLLGGMGCGSKGAIKFQQAQDVFYRVLSYAEVTVWFPKLE